MRYRWTIQELEEFSDARILRGLVDERFSTLNPYAPLAQRLKKIAATLNKQLEREAQDETL